ncbi:MAG: anthrone oxygenase family protein [Pseudomonadota bacterium]
MSVTVVMYAAAAYTFALLAGVFLAFSDFIMRSLRAASPAAGIEAMQEVNRKVYRSVFLTGFLVMAPVSAILVWYALVHVDGASSIWFATGGVIYIGGTFLVTVLGNVPMNKRLDEMDLRERATADYWNEYSVGWTRLNHLRTVAAGVSSISLFVGCLALN